MLRYIESLGTGAVFDPEAIRLLVGAFDIAWKSVETSGSEYSTEKYATMAREIVAKYIVEAAKQGELDQRQLATGALLKLSHANLKFLSK